MALRRFCIFLRSGLTMSKAETGPEATSRQADVAAAASRIVANVEKVIIGKRQQIVFALAAYLC